MQPNVDPRIDASTVGEALLKSRSFFTEDYWFWICIGALLGFSVIFNILFIVALTYLNRGLPSINFFFSFSYLDYVSLGPFLLAIGDAKPVIREESNIKKSKNDNSIEVYEGEPLAAK